MAWNKTGTQLLPKYREALHSEAGVALEGLGYVKQENGEYVLELGTIEGRPVNAIVNLAVSGRTEFAKKTPKAKEAAVAEAINLTEIFD